MFWTIAAAVLLAAALITLSPLLRDKSLWKPLALALVFILPAGAIWLYQEVGTPDAINLRPAPPRAASTNTNPNEPHATESQEMDAMIAGMQARLSESPEDLEGWLLLARTLKATQRFPEALEALETANRISPNNPVVLTDLVEARIYTTANGRVSEDMLATLKHVLEIDPGMQKALWLMGIASSQAGDYASAVDYWQALLDQLEPGTQIAQSVQEQIDGARTRIGMDSGTPPMVAEEAIAEEEPVVEDDGSWKGVSVTVSAGETGESIIPTGGVLYVMIRTPGPAMGPPLGVRRIIDPVLPLEITISDQDSMLQERQISSEAELQLQARISLTGSPAATPGDWQSTRMTAALDSAETVELVIDQRVE